ncbi:hypothetical protein, partial [uncultured Treponema sp.]|uniref:hypothetical protein n=1 Tax=uncultured Treponema sp. TaxID=162155 RepID=UPI0025CE9C1D
ANVYNYKHKLRAAGEPAVSLSRFHDWKPFFDTACKFQNSTFDFLIMSHDLNISKGKSAFII